MKKITFSVLLCTFLFANFSYSQEELQLTSKDSIIKSAWNIGVGFNFVDDSGDMFNELASVGSQWNYVPYPSRLSIERSTKSGLAFGAIGTYNKYLVGNIIDGKVNTEESTYLALDGRITFDLNKIYNESSWFDPYIGGGVGYTDANKLSRGTFNAILGFRTWFSDRWGLDFNSSGKWAMGNTGATNHIQHAVGVLYQFNIKKGLSKNGEEQLAVIEEIQKEKQRIADSTATANSLIEEALLAELLAQEKEKARLAAIEKAKLDEENNRRQSIENEIYELGKVHFALNSSFLNKDAKRVLDGLVVLLEKHKKIELQISSFTDSRGTDEYNLWLSNRRVKSTIDYLINRGIDSKRIEGSGFGEEQLTNHCDDTVICSEKEHLENRRSEFKVVKF